MKKVFIIALAVMISTLLYADDKIITLTQTPATMQLFIKTHFENIKVMKVEKDDHSYEVYLENGFEIDFDKKGIWKEIDGKIIPVPQSVLEIIPAQIQSYVNQNYSAEKIVKISHGKRGYDVELSGVSDIELKFDKNGAFKRIDD